MGKRTTLDRMLFILTSTPLVLGCGLADRRVTNPRLGLESPPSQSAIAQGPSRGSSANTREDLELCKVSYDHSAEPIVEVSYDQARARQWELGRDAQPSDIAVVLPAAPSDVDLSPSDLVLARRAETGADESPRSGHTHDAMSLEEFESLAFTNNPTLSQLASSTQKAAGFREQVRLKPNPTAGYQAMQLADAGTDQHTLFVEQEFVTGKKLQANYAVLNETLRAQLLELDAQRERLATDVRVKFYSVLLAQTRLDLIQEFRSVTEQGVEIARLRLDAQEGSRIDLLQSQIQQNEITLMRRQAEIARVAAWQELAAIAGVPDLPLTRAVGELPNDYGDQNWETVASQIVLESPEYQAAQARIARARMDLHRQGIQPLPNVTMQLAAGIDRGTESGMLNLQVGAPLPIFNKNQGNIAAARAEYYRAVRDAERVEQSLRARLATVSGEYDQALAAVQVYSSEIVPSARESLELAEVAYKSGETSFLQVLQARRTFFETNLKYVEAAALLAQSKAKVDGFLLIGALDPVVDDSGDDALRDRTFSQQ